MLAARPCSCWSVTAGRVWWFARQDDRRASDAIVVLGAAQFDGRPSSVFTARLVHARDLWKDDVAPRIITVGRQPRGRPVHRGVGRQELADRARRAGRPGRRGRHRQRHAEQRGARVETQMKSSDWSTAVVVTDPWHALRTRSMATDQGIDAVMSPTRQGPAVRQRGDRDPLHRPRDASRYLYYKVFGAAPTTARTRYDGRL